MPPKQTTIPLITVPDVYVRHNPDQDTTLIYYKNSLRLTYKSTDTSHLFELHYTTIRIDPISIPKTIIALDINYIIDAILSYGELQGILEKMINPLLEIKSKSKSQEAEIKKHIQKASDYALTVIKFANEIIDQSFKYAPIIKDLLPTLQLLEKNISSISSHHPSVIKPLASVHTLIGKSHHIIGDNNEALKHLSCSIEHLANSVTRNLDSGLRHVFVETAKEIETLRTKLPQITIEQIAKIAKAWPNSIDESDKIIATDMNQTLASIHLTQENTKEAISHYNNALKTTHPETKHIILNAKAEACYNAQKHTEAIESFKQALSHKIPHVKQQDVTTYTSLAQKYFENGFFGMAVNLGEKSIAQKECTTPAQEEALYYILSLAYAYLEYHEKASDALNVAISLNTESEPLLHDLLSNLGQRQDNNITSELITILSQTQDTTIVQKLNIIQTYYYAAAIMSSNTPDLTKKYYEIALNIGNAVQTYIEQPAQAKITEVSNTDISKMTQDEIKEFMQDPANVKLYKKILDKKHGPCIEKFKTESLTLNDKVIIIKMLTIKEQQHKAGNRYDTQSRFEGIKVDAIDYTLEQLSKATIQADPYQKIYLDGYNLYSEKHYAEARQYYQKALVLGKKIPLHEQARLLIEILEITRTELPEKAYDKKLSAIQQCLSEVKSKFHIDNHFTALLEILIGETYLDNEKIIEARAQFSKAAKIFYDTSATYAHTITSGAYQELLLQTYISPREYDKALRLLINQHKIHTTIEQIKDLEAIYEILEKIYILDYTQSHYTLRKIEEVLLQVIDMRESNKEYACANKLGINYHNLTMLYLTKGEKDKALECALKAREAFDTESTAFQFINTSRVLSEIYFYKQDYQNTIDYANEWLRETDMPAFEKTHLSLLFNFYIITSKAYDKLGLTEQALAFAEKTLPLNIHEPQQYVTYTQIGFYKLKLARYDEAIISLKAAFEKAHTTKENGVIHKYLADTYYAQAHATEGEPTQQSYHNVLKHYNLAIKSELPRDMALEIYAMFIMLNIDLKDDANILDSLSHLSDYILDERCIMVSTIITKYLEYSRESNLWLDIAITTIKDIEDHEIHDNARAKFCVAVGKYQMLKESYHDAFINFARAIGIEQNPEIIALWHKAQHALDSNYVIPGIEDPIIPMGANIDITTDGGTS